MKKIMSVKSYNIVTHNCHIAQESTRYALDLAEEKDLSYFSSVYKLLHGKKGGEKVSWGIDQGI